MRILDFLDFVTCNVLCKGWPGWKILGKSPSLFAVKKTGCAGLLVRQNSSGCRSVARVGSSVISVIQRRFRVCHASSRLNVLIHVRSNKTEGSVFKYHHTSSITVTDLDIMANSGNRMHWDLTADYIAAEAERLIEESKAVYDSIGSLNADTVTYDNVIEVELQSQS